MSLQPPKATHVGQVWVDPITADAFVWTGPKNNGDYWSEWEPWKPEATMRCRLCDRRVEVAASAAHLEERHTKDELAAFARTGAMSFWSVEDAA